jgi:hypothetical protein
MTEAAASIAPGARRRDAAWPRLSVVMPYRDAAPFVAEAVRSVLDQTYANLELLAIDDGSTDDSAAIVHGLAAKDARVRPIAAERDGFVPALNQGIRLARGEFIGRMDADDASLPDRFARQIAYLDAHPEVGALGGQILAVSDAQVRIPPWWVDNPLDHDTIVATLRSRNAISHPTAIIRRSLMEEIGGYRPAFTVVQDYDLWLRLAERTRLANLPERLLRYRFHRGQATERHVELAYLCTWTARHSAESRRSGRPDPVREDTVIDRGQVAAWGLPGAAIDAEIHWIKASHRARAHLLRGDRLRAAAAFATLAITCPGPFLRRGTVAVRSRLLGRSKAAAVPDVASPSPAWPVSR